MNSLNDEDFKQIKEICKDDIKQNDIEIIIIYALKINLIFVFVKYHNLKLYYINIKR
jgi:hypothetical protein